MKLVGSGEQQVQHFLFDASGTITTGGTPQLVLPRHPSRSHFYIQNTTASGNLTVEFGSARATCTISGGAVTAGGFTITNAGFNFKAPPIIRFLGGGQPQGGSGYAAGPNSSYNSTGGPNFPSPPNVATAVATLTGGSLSGITLTNPGSGYVSAPMVFIMNSDLDPLGVAIPTASIGALLTPGGGAIFYNGTACPTDAVSIFGATTGMTFCCKYMT